MTDGRTERMECGAGPDQHGVLGIYAEQPTSYVVQGGTKNRRLPRGMTIGDMQRRLEEASG